MILFGTIGYYFVTIRDQNHVVAIRDYFVTIRNYGVTIRVYFVTVRDYFVTILYDSGLFGGCPDEFRPAQSCM